MQSRDIPIDQWPSFFNRFSRLHERALVTVNVSAPEVGDIDAVRDQSFNGISTEGDELILHVGPHLDHRILHVDSVHLKQTDEGGADAEIDIDAMDGIRTIVRFRSPMRADLLDSAVE